jgi:hypothetical protein
MAAISLKFASCNGFNIVLPRPRNAPLFPMGNVLRKHSQSPTKSRCRAEMRYDFVDVHNVDYSRINDPLTTLFKKLVDRGIGTRQDTHTVTNDRLPQIGAKT